MSYGMEEKSKRSNAQGYDLESLSLKMELLKKENKENYALLDELMLELKNEENTEIKKEIAYKCFSLAKDLYVLQTTECDAFQAEEYSNYRDVILTVMDYLDSVQEPGHNPLLIATANLDRDFIVSLLQKGADPFFVHREYSLNARSMALYVAQSKENIEEDKEKAFELFKLMVEEYKNN